MAFSLLHHLLLSSLLISLVSAQSVPQGCTPMTSQAYAIKARAQSHIGEAFFNISQDINGRNWFMQIFSMFDSDAKLVHDVLKEAGTSPPTYHLGFYPFWYVDMMISSKQWLDKSQPSLTADEYSWIIIPCDSACDGDVIAGPAYFDDQADLVLGMVGQYLNGIPQTLTGVVNSVMQMTRVAVVTEASTAMSPLSKQVVISDVFQGQIAENDWAFRWFGNVTRKNMYTCRRLNVNQLS